MNAEDQFNRIAHDYYEPLLRFALSLAHTETEARDLTQQTFVVWAAKGSQLRDPSCVKAWLFTTLHRAFLKARQRQTRFPHHDLESVAHELPPSGPGSGSQLDFDRLRAELARLEGPYRAAVTLFYLDEYSYNEVAFALGVPIGTVKSRIARGVARLRAILLPSRSRAAASSRKSSTRSLRPVPPETGLHPVLLASAAFVQPRAPMGRKAHSAAGTIRRPRIHSSVAALFQSQQRFESQEHKKEQRRLQYVAAGCPGTPLEGRLRDKTGEAYAVN